uniref:Uncharacterized protein n=1 Tax=Sphaerodactylus townsendi TaxID=933632 RepID=A0ACB8EB07_9SAUR
MEPGADSTPCDPNGVCSGRLPRPAPPHPVVAMPLQTMDWQGNVAECVPVQGDSQEIPLSLPMVQTNSRAICAWWLKSMLQKAQGEEKPCRHTNSPKPTRAGNSLFKTAKKVQQAKETADGLQTGTPSNKPFLGTLVAV